MDIININPEDKQEYLNKNNPFREILNIKERRICIHCEKWFTVEDFIVIQDDDGEEYISCPNYPDCDGTITDWFEHYTIPDPLN